MDDTRRRRTTLAFPRSFSIEMFSFEIVFVRQLADMRATP